MAVMSGHPLLQLLVGLLWSAACAGLGAGLLAAFTVRLRAPWSHVTSVLTGLVVVGFGVFALGVAGVASRSVLIGVLALVCGVGLPCAYRLLRELAPTGARLPSGWAWVPAAAAVLGLLLTLGTAMAPSSKHDELHYHMLIPKRIVEDGALVAYRRPWPSTTTLHTLVQMGHAPLHAVGVPDAANVVSWCTGLALAWFVWFLLSRRPESGTWPYVWLPIVTVGFHFAIHAPAAGPRMFGDLAAIAGVLFVLGIDRDRDDPRLDDAACAIGILTVCAAIAKAIYLPLSVLLLAFGLVRLRCMRPGDRGTWADFAIAWRVVTPWLVVAGPVLAWTWWRTGSPLGVLTARWFGDSYYDVGVLRLIDVTLRGNRHGLTRFAYLFATAYTPLALCGAVFLFMRSVPRRLRVLAGTACITQAAVVAFLTPQFPRFLGGLPVAAAVLVALHTQPATVKRFSRRAAVIASLMVLPWLAAQAWYASAFLPVATGWQSRAEFCRAYVGVFDDYRELDAILPPDAVLYWDGYRINAAYAPRPVQLHPRDVSVRGPLYVMVVDGRRPEVLPDGYRLGERVYENDGATLVAFRTPGREARIGTLEVFRAERVPNDGTTSPASAPPP